MEAAPANSETTSFPRAIVLYDGVCGLCSETVRWLLRHDTHEFFYFAPLQGDTAARLRSVHPEIPTELDSVVYIEDGRVFLRSRAFVELARHLNPPWRWAYSVRWFPTVLVDIVYRTIARVRYRIWGKVDACPVATPRERARILP